MEGKYRDKLVEIIKQAGQDLIDRADDIIPKEDQMVTNYNINIEIPAVECIPTITWTMTTLIKNQYQALIMGVDTVKTE